MDKPVSNALSKLRQDPTKEVALSDFASNNEHLMSPYRCKISDQVWSPENNAHMCAIIRTADIYVLVVHCYGGCVRDALGRAGLLFSVDQACAQSASHRLVTVLAVT
ncbi:MAG: hypothetical protein ACRESJ_28555 [Pseudomonas sp.]|uniref:hypothetical protein n=1 Tax=Pseudomonas sp. TaxID=306 RepID=UPI003D6E4367